MSTAAIRSGYGLPAELRRRCLRQDDRPEARREGGAGRLREASRDVPSDDVEARARPGRQPGSAPDLPRERATGYVADADGDGFLAPADCGPTDPAIHPGAPDPPDSTYADANCDGIDGDKALAVFVAATGSNIPGCGALTTPCQTIQVGLQEAGSQGKHQLYVGSGSYAGPLSLAASVDVCGGYSATWARSAATTGPNQAVTITGGLRRRASTWRSRRSRSRFR